MTDPMVGPSRVASGAREVRSPDASACSGVGSISWAVRAAYAAPEFLAVPDASVVSTLVDRVMPK